MSDSNRRWLFGDKQIRRLTLDYLHSHGTASTEDIHAFLNACIQAATIGESVMMAADGTLLIDWDKERASLVLDYPRADWQRPKRNSGKRRRTDEIHRDRQGAA